jgi:hypothetical protein
MLQVSNRTNRPCNGIEKNYKREACERAVNECVTLRHTVLVKTVFPARVDPIKQMRQSITACVG